LKTNKFLGKDINSSSNTKCRFNWWSWK